MKFLFSLAAALLSLGLTQPTLSAPLESVVIIQCSVAGTAYQATARPRRPQCGHRKQLRPRAGRIFKGRLYVQEYPRRPIRVYRNLYVDRTTVTAAPVNPQ